MNITKGKFKKLLKAGNKKQTNKIKKKFILGEKNQIIVH